MTTPLPNPNQLTATYQATVVAVGATFTHPPHHLRRRPPTPNTGITRGGIAVQQHDGVRVDTLKAFPYQKHWRPVLGTPSPTSTYAISLLGRRSRRTQLRLDHPGSAIAQRRQRR